MIVRRVGAVSFAKISGVLYALFGLIAGAFISLFSIVGGAFMPKDATSGMGGMIFGVAATVRVPAFRHLAVRLCEQQVAERARVGPALRLRVHEHVADRLARQLVQEQTRGAGLAVAPDGRFD